MYRIAAGLTSVTAGALAGFPGTSGTLLAVIGSVLVLSGLDRTIPAQALVVRTARSARADGRRDRITG